jgi:hypothetical protein
MNSRIQPEPLCTPKLVRDPRRNLIVMAPLEQPGFPAVAPVASSQEDVENVTPGPSGSVFDQIFGGAELIMEPGGVHELRILNAGRERTISGYFDDPMKLARAATELDATGRYPGIYITLNPGNPDLLARARNRALPYAKATTSDKDITRRRWLLIDSDPKRVSGISSTDAEHGRAITTACGVLDDLRGAGFGDPVVCDSGNGAHLLYRIDMPNTQQATDLIRRTLKGIARHCAPEDVDIDLTVYNASRIIKLYGTMARKGDSTPERPHRRSRILEIPSLIEPIRLETR